MCRVDDDTKTMLVRQPPASMGVDNKPISLRMLLSLDSFDVISRKTKPTSASCTAFCFTFIGFLIVMENFFKNSLFSMKHVHPILENERNRLILARHLGVDIISCAMCSVLGWFGRHIVADAFYQLFGGLFFSSTTLNGRPCDAAAYDERLFTYHPEGYRLSLVFLSYQIKNLYDSWIWNDGPEFIFHHVFSGLAAMAVIHGGIGSYYSLFYFGLSEISTAVLSLLANFDDIHGVPGLGDAFPLVKVTIGGLFVVLFVICRCIMWPMCSYRYCHDVINLFKYMKNDDKTKRSKGWILYLSICNISMSLLQVAWLGQIVTIAKEEFANVRLI